MIYHIASCSNYALSVPFKLREPLRVTISKLLSNKAIFYSKTQIRLKLIL
jgi:hypothetical protein